ncbi:hypothetical protein C8R44DRAFT_745365 [Mycena epipterygia]|nr:hypothetical protein C8R44DRAFT_745365 [Mycena epipterygia]
MDGGCTVSSNGGLKQDVQRLQHARPAAKGVDLPARVEESLDDGGDVVCCEPDVGEFDEVAQEAGRNGGKEGGRDEGVIGVIFGGCTAEASPADEQHRVRTNAAVRRTGGMHQEESQTLGTDEKSSRDKKEQYGVRSVEQRQINPENRARLYI